MKSNNEIHGKLYSGETMEVVMDLQKEIGANIRDLRKRRGIRINELARAISKSSATVSKI